MTREEKLAILIYDSVWTEEDENVFVEKVKSAIKSFLDNESHWHKVSEELPEVDKYRKYIKVFARRGDDVFVAFYSPIAGFSLSSSFYTEYILSNIEYWMPIPELPKEN